MMKIESAIRSSTISTGPARFIAVAEVSRPRVTAFTMMTPMMKFWNAPDSMKPFSLSTMYALFRQMQLRSFHAVKRQ